MREPGGRRADGGATRDGQPSPMTDARINRGRMRGLAQRLGARRAGETSQRFSTMLRQVSEQAHERITLAELVQVFGDRAFGALMLIFAIPNVLPLPPGSSSVLGAPLILIAGQLAIGRRVLWLPAAFLGKSVPRDYLRRVVARLLPSLRWMERMLAPRLGLLFGPVGDRLIGITCLVLSIILFLPIPFGNMLPAAAIACFSLGLIQKDGAAAILGYLLAMISLGVLAAISGALWIAAQAFFNALFG
jgi:hypothetical protein